MTALAERRGHGLRDLSHASFGLALLRADIDRASPALAEALGGSLTPDAWGVPARGGEAVEDFGWGLDYSEEHLEATGEPLPRPAGQWVAITRGRMSYLHTFQSRRRAVPDDDLRDAAAFLDATLRGLDAYLPAVAETPGPDPRGGRLTRGAGRGAYAWVDWIADGGGAAAG